MKNKLFCKVTTKATLLVMGSLVAFSGQALAFSSNTSNNREFTNADALGNSKSFIAQTPTTTSHNPNTPLTPQERVALAQSVARAYSTLGNAIVVINAAAIPASAKVAIARSLSQAIALIGNALALSNSAAITKGDAAAIAQLVFKAQSLIGAALGIFGVPEFEYIYLANVIVAAETAAGNAGAVATAVAS